MNINTKSLVPIAEANENFSKVAKLVDELGSAVIMQNNKPRYLLIDFSQVDDVSTADDEDVLALSRKIMLKNKEAYVLAK